MKKCPLCGKEYESENMCPVCNILLIDMDSNQAVREESTKEKKKRLQKEQKDEQTKNVQGSRLPEGTAMHNTSGQSTGASINLNSRILAMVGGALVIIVIVIFLFKLIFGNKEDQTTIQQIPQTTVQESTTSEVKLNEKDFARNELVDFKTDSFKFQLPSYWRQLCTVETTEDTIWFYQKRSKKYGGFLFCVTVVNSDDMDDLNEYRTILEDGNIAYVMEYPTELTYDSGDEYTKLEYERLVEDETYVFQTFEGLKESSRRMQGEYIIPDSDTKRLSDSDLQDLTEQELLYARNEIYARHGRRFQDTSIQEYFESKDWYNGTIDPEDFRDDMLNDVERANAQFILSYEKNKGYQ